MKVIDGTEAANQLASDWKSISLRGDSMITRILLESRAGGRRRTRRISHEKDLAEGDWLSRCQDETVRQATQALRNGRGDSLACPICGTEPTGLIM